MRRGLWCGTFALLLPLLGCASGGSGRTDAGDVPGDGEDGGDGTEADGDDADADVSEGTDGTDADGADADAVAGQTAVSLTAGGGRATSPSYQLTLSIGTPQPMGSATSGAHGATMGPGAAVNQ
ncbi:MAG: hypothetical protein HY907_08605 [Deltaproteobacteria bacterium]|nr:hypothetical protein [Deltaproteobacteria bacterium]